ncbi:MAG: creatininase family protein, partial [Caulobacteraceae bacterium]|nr:creatininase family protein [Caulobacteraceae bacterium]
PSGHMRFPGTITVAPETFRATIKSAARSFALHGFRHVVLLGDHGGYQGDLALAADDLNRAWTASGSPARAHYIGAYYGATQTEFVRALHARGYSDAEIGRHAGLADASLTLAIAPDMVRAPRLRGDVKPGPSEGVYGDPRRASAALGQLGADTIVQQSIEAIRTAERGR